MQYRSLALGVAVALSSSPISAQSLPARVVNHGGGFEFELSYGEPISFFLEYASELQLTDQQRSALMAIRRRLRQTNAPFYRQLDSLRNEVGLDLEPKPRLTQRDREALERFQKLSRPVADSMRVNNDAARTEAWTLLEQVQRTRADSIVKADRGARGGRDRPSGQ